MPTQECLRQSKIRNFWETGLICLLLLSAVMITGCPSKTDTKKSPEPFLKAGNEAMSARNWGTAVENFSQMIRLDEKNKDAFYRRAGAYLAKAKDHYNLAQAAATKREKTTAEKEAKTADENFALSEKDARSAVGLDENFSEAWYLLGCIAIYQGDWKGAIDHFSQCVKLDPKNPRGWQRRGEVYQYLGDESNAIPDLKKASELGYKGK